ncbi:unnamed protein product (macronuclear) [Paramecium tetraurelia]|uniref:Uncharacterized protein n=1 Tax=Paramecium tetraurelia TaxID=5888 RepID=A0C8R4_PARTE|nr:uncharacterized protein GSPATT00036316001 [Paramecium tetraurelia]CAK67181.1 unnamed protein product [Paramecium tetraurelia]|eukprot:XP_001434578.1 hypothetical protein (macronuclear) [Paramecium tetraurelia strain d4-2]
MELESALLCKHNLQAIKIINDPSINPTQRLLCHLCLNEHQDQTQLINISIAFAQATKNYNQTSKYSNQILLQSILHLNTFIQYFKLLQVEIKDVCEQTNLKALQWLQNLQQQQNKEFIQRFDQSFNNYQGNIHDEDLNEVNYRFLNITQQYLPGLNSLITPFNSLNKFDPCYQTLLQLSKVNIEDAIQQLYVENQCRTVIEKIERMKQNNICDQEFTNIKEMIVNSSEQNKGIQSEIIEQLTNLIRLRQRLSQSIHHLESELTNRISQQNGEYFKSVQNLDLLINEGSLNKLIEKIHEIGNDQVIIMRKEFKSKLTNCIQGVLTNNLKGLQRQSVSNDFILHKLINTEIIQKDCCYAIQFNKDTSIMISTSGKNIKVWDFNKGRLTLGSILQKHIDDVSCLLFSNYSNSFISGCGNEDGSIVCWQQDYNFGWKSSKQFKQHRFGLRCMIVNHDETQLITGSLDKSIVIWKLDFKENNLVYEYSLFKHQHKLLSLSMNDSETCMISCSEDQNILIWGKQQGIWKFKDVLKQSVQDIGRQIKFLSDTEFIWLQQNQGRVHFFEGSNFRFQEKPENQLLLNNQKQDWNLFPIQYNKPKNIIVIRHNSTVFILRKQLDGNLKIMADPIQCQSEFNYGSLSKDGQYMVLWDVDSNQYNVYEILV